MPHNVDLFGQTAYDSFSKHLLERSAPRIDPFSVTPSQIANEITRPMFGLFRKKVLQPTVTQEDKDWIEQNLAWFIQVFGLAQLRARPFLMPTIEDFPYENLNDPKQFQKFFEQVCRIWDLNPDEINARN